MLRWKVLWLASLAFTLVACRGEPLSPKWDWSETLPNGMRAEQALIRRDTLYFSNWGHGIDGSPVAPVVAAFDLTDRKLLWQVQQDVLIPMDADSERLFILNDSGLQALSLKDGSTLWRADVAPANDSDDHAYGELMSRDGQVFFTENRDSGGVVTALNAESGAIVWTVSLDAQLDVFRPWAPPEHWDTYRTVNYDRARLYVREYLGDSSDGERFRFLLIALDARDGHRLWEFPFDTPVRRGDAPPGGSSRPAVSERAVYFGAYGGVTYALDRETGNLLCQRQLELDLPIFANGQVLGITAPSALAAIDPESGRVKWTLEDSGLYATDFMAFTDQALYVYAGTYGRRELAVADIQKGVWLSVTRPQLAHDCVDSPRAFALNGDSLYLATLNCVERFQVSR